MKYKYLIINFEDNYIIGTNDLTIAAKLGEFDPNTIVDVTEGKLLNVLEPYTEIQEVTL